MTSLRQIEANRRNALNSTGPKSELGKQHSRSNAMRHGLTAETVIRFLEDEQDYREFELSVTSDFDARTAVERELVLRRAGLLWRLRRATAIETAPFPIEFHIATADKQGATAPVHQSVTATMATAAELMPTVRSATDHAQIVSEIAARFLALCHANDRAFERLIRYETALWRQVGQLLATLEFLRRYPVF